MKEQDKSVSIKIRSESKETLCRGEVKIYSTSEALKKAMWVYLATWIMIVICIFIPLVHFIAVPGLLIMGPFFSFLVFKSFNHKEDLILENASCPICKNTLSLPTALDVWPVRDHCASCGAFFTAEYI